MNSIGVGLIGCGVIGRGVWNAINRNGDLLASRSGVRIRLVRVADNCADAAKHVPKELFTENWRDVIEDESVQIVLELVGGTTVAKEIVTTALKAGKLVVTANKALLSQYGEEIFDLAREMHTNIYYEASVAGSIPIIKILRESLVSNKIKHIYGIVNGTSNYILSQMSSSGASLHKALGEATRLGYAERDPSLDIEGDDSAHKIAILASLANGMWIKPSEIYTEGIAKVKRDPATGKPLRQSRSHGGHEGPVLLEACIDVKDIRYAKEIGYTIKLLAIMRGSGTTPPGIGTPPRPLIQLSVYPALIPSNHVLANVNDAYNSILVEGDLVGQASYYGRGAGADPTAAAISSDLVDAARDITHKSIHRQKPFAAQPDAVGIRPIGECVSRYYLRLPVKRQPGTLHDITGVMAKYGIGIRSLMLSERKSESGKYVPLVMLLHTARNMDMDSALQELIDLPVVGEPVIKIRVEDFE